MPTYQELLRARTLHRLVPPFAATETRARTAINEVAGVAGFPAFGRRREAAGLGMRLRIHVSREARWVWLAVLTFVSMSAWWLTQDDRVPDWDSGIHELFAEAVHRELAGGQLTRPFTDYNSYPPLVHVVGALSSFLLGLHPSAFVLSSNVVFVPLLAFGCFGVGRIAYGPRAGLLAAVLALGSPMFVSMMHEYELDPPQAAMVAVTVWALLASRRYERIGVAALAGVLCGLTLLTKETSVVFLAGIVMVSSLRAGRQRYRGQLAFALATCLVAGPWYAYHAADVRSTLDTIGGWAANSQLAPARLSLSNVTWYGWDLVTEQVLVVFAVAFLIGVALALSRLLRHRLAASNVEPELLAGAFVSYLGMTLLTHKDPRYTLPVLVYVAVLATGWIANLRFARWRRLLSGSVAVVAAVYLVGISAGIGRSVAVRLPGAQPPIIGQLTLYETAGWLRGGPVQDGKVAQLLTGLRSAGIRAVVLYTGSDPIDFNTEGLSIMANAAGLGVEPGTAADVGVQPVAGVPLKLVASLILAPPGSSGPQPCQRLNDGSRIYVVRGDTAALPPASSNPRQHSTFLCPGSRG